MSDEMMALRCKYCGAPLDDSEIRSDSAYVRCSSCGTTQQRMDAKQYLDQLLGQVKSWVSSAIPTGFNMSGAENVDPVARHSIFVKDVGPKIRMELTEYKFSNTCLLGNCLLAVPFSTTNVFRPVHTSSKAFEFNAKVKSVSQLAVDADSQSLINEAATVSQSYAMMINNIALISENKEGRYTLMANNFTESSKALKGTKGNELVELRFEALADVCNGMEKLLSGDMVNSSALIRKGRTSLSEIKNKVFTDPQYGIMYQAMEQEIAVCDIVLNITDIVSTSPSNDPLAMLEIIKDVMDVKMSYPQKWGYLLGNKDRFGEVFDNIVEALSAKNGGTLPISAGQGNILMPFWEVDLRYSFVTGSLWAKKSVEVKEDLLICADFVTDPICLDNPSSALTDIFSLRPEKSILAGIKGSETSISGGEGICKIQDSVANNSVGNRRVVLPLSTRKEADKICTEYLLQRTEKDSKLKLSKPDVKRIVYIPCTENGGAITLPESFGNLSPEHVRRAGTLSMLII